jgi:hypothetical protein
MRVTGGGSAARVDVTSCDILMQSLRNIAGGSGKREGPAWVQFHEDLGNVNSHLWQEARGMLHLDSTATRNTEVGAPHWLHRPMRSVYIDKVPVLAQHAEQGAKVTTKNVLASAWILAQNSLREARKRTSRPARLSLANQSA